MLTINPVNVNNPYKTNKQSQPSFGYSFKISPEASKDIAEFLNHNKMLYKGGVKNNIKDFTYGVKTFCKNAFEINKHFGMDGLKCLLSESFTGKTNQKAMERILTENVTAATEYMEGTASLVPNMFARQYRISGSNRPIADVKRFSIIYEPDEKQKIYIPLNETTFSKYFPFSLSLNNLNRAVNNIDNEVECAYIIHKYLH